MISIRFKALCVLVILAGAVEALAASRTYRFLYRPDPGNPASNAFVDQNPIGCGFGLPPCRPNEYGLNLYTVPGPLSAGPASRSTPMFRASNEWRTITLLNGSTGHTLEANIRAVGVAGVFNFTPGLTQLVPEANGDIYVAYSLLFGGTGAWSYPPSPCVTRRPGYAGNDRQQTFSISTSSAPCMLPLIRDVEEFRISATLIYEILLPRPQLAQAGIYTGQVRYTTGPGMDVDFGDAVLTADSEMLINLRLEVDPIFKVEFPGGSTLMSLEPDGGWLNWLNRGRKPTRLWREQAFGFSTSIPFKMIMQCEHTLGNHCAIAASNGHHVPVEIRMTLPAGMQDAAGRPIHDYLLNPHETPQLDPTRIILGQKGKLQFEVPKPEMESMLDHAGKAYSGQVTFIWDAQI